MRERIPEGWLYLADPFPFQPTTPCLLVTFDEADAADTETQAIAEALGFTHEGLDNQTLEDVASSAEALHLPPSDALLVEAFNYYHRWDAFLPRPGAPDPQPRSEAQQRQEFMARLGQEVPGTHCKHPGCERGVVLHSVFCAEHHYEQLRRS